MGGWIPSIPDGMAGPRVTVQRFGARFSFVRHTGAVAAKAYLHLKTADLCERKKRRAAFERGHFNWSGLHRPAHRYSLVLKVGLRV